MSATPAVAVIIPCYNAARWLADAIDSVRAQSLPPAEVVVVDDGSTDGSGAIAERAGVRCVHQQQRGPAAARNRGIRATAAPLLAFLDADDCFAPGKLAAQLEHLHRTGAVLSCTDAWVWRDRKRIARKNASLRLDPMITFERLLQGNPIICSSVVARRDAVEQAGMFDEDPVLIATEDYDLWLRIARRGQICYLDEPLVDYRLVEGNLSDDERFVRGVDRIMDKMCAEHGAAVTQLADRRRAAVRIDLAYHSARRGRGADARQRLAEARRLGAGIAATWKIWVRSWRSG